MNFEHKGVKIQLQPSGKFTAAISGCHVVKPSLDAMKKFIDESEKMQFEPFTALIHASYGDKPVPGLPDYTRVTVIGVARSSTTRRFSRHENDFIVERTDKHGSKSTGDTSHVVYADTPENIALLKAEAEKKTEARNSAERYSKEVGAIQKQQKTVNPDAFTANKRKS